MRRHLRLPLLALSCALPAVAAAFVWPGGGDGQARAAATPQAGASASATDEQPVPSSVTLRRGTRAWRVGRVLARKAWKLDFTTTTGRQVTMVAKSRDTTGRRAFVADIRCGKELIARGFGRRGKRVRLTFKRPPSDCVLRFRSGKQKVKYRATLAVSNR